MKGMAEVAWWADELESVFGRVAGGFGRADLRWRMRDYVRGLLGQAARKNGWQLAEWAGHRTPDGFQRLLNSSVWDADALRDDVRAYVAERLGPDGVLIIDDTGFIKKGTTSAGVGRQYTGTSGKIDNCQIGVFAAYATRSGRALVDRELYLPKAWTSDRDRCRGAKIPDERGFATKGELARDIVRRCIAAGLPAAWVTADEAYGQDWHFRRLLEQLDVGYVVAVPKSQQIKSLAGIWRIDQLIKEAPVDAWQRLPCGHGAKGPRVYDWAAARLPANLVFDADPPTRHRWVMARRSLSDPGRIAYYLAYSPVGIEIAELVRIAGSRWAVEECFQAAKNECGLDQYEVRRYIGWYRHITLAMLAHAVLAALAAQATTDAAKGAAETDRPSSRSPWQRSGGSWTLSCPTHEPTVIPSPTH
ncbi:IS701 family transposase [Streptomyces sp. GMY02]|uniref:IS701 family transposase n=1 Tax=Streptomyces sp. GMY02 TaxID=1333528 RepID=UPI001C2BF125|nr:IS701 family transposase [Streptomyces sp. GMY02]QXE35908.1 IS701 family transposase [Streptomyces sp. GMY02]QXE35910.1 IS701 family transposase [Streptomyces sp. GMY02]QXE38647.1 IS701 family transposase [Streptomyces sp. GMY02]